MPKHISGLQIWSVSLFSLVTECLSDMILDLKLNLFGYFSPGYQWSGFLPIFLYPPINAVFLNYYPYKARKWYRLLYIVGWIAFCLGYEIAALKSKFFYYHHWKLWYSAMCYPVLLLMVLCNFKFTQWLQRRDRSAHGG
ncbi:CBO0543 family protein [Alicyclobacillus sacchari]